MPVSIELQDHLFGERVHAFETVAAELYHFRYLG